MVHRGGLALSPAHHDAPIRHPPEPITRTSSFFLLLAVAELVVITTMFDVGLNSHNDFLSLLVRSLLVVAVVIAFNVAMLLMLLPLAPCSETISPTVASRLERVAAVGSLMILLLATSLFIAVAFICDRKPFAGVGLPRHL